MTPIELPPSQLESMLSSIVGAIGLGQPDIALELADAVLTVVPNQPDAALLKAEVLGDIGRRGEALASLEALAAHHGDNAEVWRRLGNVSLSTGDTERAVEAYRQWQRLAGPAADNEAALALAYLTDLDLRRAHIHADAAVAAGGDVDTRTFATRLGQLHDDADVEAEAGWWLGSLGAPERGLALLQASLEQRNQPITQRRIGALLASLRRVDEAIPFFRAAVEGAPDELTWQTELGTALLITGDPDGAAERIDAVLTVSPGDPTATIAAGRVAIQQGDAQRAIELAGRLLGDDPDAVEAWLLRSDAHLVAGRPAHALVDAEHAIGCAPSDRRVWDIAATAAHAARHEALAHRYRARASIHLSGSLGFAEGHDLDDQLPDDLTDELHELDPIVVADPLIRGIYGCRAQIAESLFDATRAVAYLDAAIARGTVEASPGATCYRATLLMLAGDLDRAETEFRAILAADPGFPDAAEGVAEITRRRAASEPATSAPGPWTPTHHSPPTGTAAYQQPGGKESPVADLQPGLAVEVLEQSTKWAHVRCENGWECWADLTLLVPISDSWMPTHAIPGAGMASRAAPYPNSADAGEVAGGLQIEVIKRAGSWAHVRFENGWTCWLAGDPLEPLA